MNHKRVYRLYCEECLSLKRHKPKRHVSSKRRHDRPAPTGRNQVWAMDFVADQLFDGRRFRVLTVVDVYSRECLTLLVGQSIKGDDVVRAMNDLRRHRGAPQTICVDNGSEFRSRAMDHWAYSLGVELDFSRPGKPTDNAMIEAFNSRFRQECLNEHWFLGLADARKIIGVWRRDYNTNRPHSSLGNRTPAEFVRDSADAPVASPPSHRQTLEIAQLTPENSHAQWT